MGLGPGLRPHRACCAHPFVRRRRTAGLQDGASCPHAAKCGTMVAHCSPHCGRIYARIHCNGDAVLPLGLRDAGFQRSLLQQQLRRQLL